MRILILSLVLLVCFGGCTDIGEQENEATIIIENYTEFVQVVESTNGEKVTCQAMDTKEMIISWSGDITIDIDLTANGENKENFFLIANEVTEYQIGY